MTDDSQIDATATEQPEVLVQLSMNEPTSTIAVSGHEAESESDDRTARQRITDHFEDTVEAGSQHVSQILEGTGLPRSTVDPLLTRLTQAGVLERDPDLGPGHYRLAPPKPVAPPPPAPTEPPQPTDTSLSDEEWVEHLWRWERGERWSAPGAAPDRRNGIMVAGCKVSMNAWAIYCGQRDAVAQQRAEDDALIERLLPAAAGNVMRGPRLDDVRPIRIALASGVPLETIEHVVRSKHDLRISPKNMPLRDWSELLPHVAEHYGRFTLARKLLAKWRATLDNPAATTAASPTLKRALSEIAPQETAGAPEASADHQGPHATQGDQEASAAWEPAADLLMRKFGVEPGDVLPNEAVAPPPDPLATGRASIAAAFRRRQVPAATEPAAASVQPAPEPQEELSNRPWWAGPRETEPQEAGGLSTDAIDEWLTAFRYNTAPWPRQLLGPAPGEEGCRVSRQALRRNGL